MGKNKRETSEKDTPRTVAGWLVLIIPGAFALAGVIFKGIVDFKIEKLKQEHEIEMKQNESAYEQYFYNNSSIVEKSGIEYIQYNFTSEPIVGGYHVITYPYLVYEMKDDKVYIPIIGQFTQEEYAADENGCCTLFRENTSEGLQKMVESIVGFSIEIKCLAAIQYVEEEQEKREVYDVRDGQLKKSDQEIVVKVLSVWENDNSVKIDMRGWPCIDQEGLKKMF